ncbi:hypothetical protein DPMN_099751 [Dreissena polymorpha]|uniref:Uncharacterized protein n=1 Tax=Dreissena polymorpha TaxID=45954 RepID=A0A9D4LFI4_DREPO|nr:hypothetical protein DPMN_099751 [Dreissena polymorpha]
MRSESGMEGLTFHAYTKHRFTNSKGAASFSEKYICRYTQPPVMSRQVGEKRQSYDPCMMDQTAEVQWVSKLD